MALIFDRFNSQQDAERFVAKLKVVMPERQATVYLDAEKASSAACFPFELDIPVVLVTRLSNLESPNYIAQETQVTSIANEFGGEFAGT